MQAERTAEEARRRVTQCAALLNGATSAPSRRFYQHIYESWLRTANYLELKQAMRDSNATKLNWVRERG